MTESLAVIPAQPCPPQTKRFDELRAVVLNSVVSVHSKRNYAKALDELQAFCLGRQAVLSRSLLLEFRGFSAVNLQLNPGNTLITNEHYSGILVQRDSGLVVTAIIC